MEDCKKDLEVIAQNQKILNAKLDKIIYMLVQSQYMSNCQIFMQGLSLADIMNVEAEGGKRW